MSRTFWLETLGCPKNQVDSDKIRARMGADGLTEASGPESADVVVVNTCAFVSEAREESVATILELHEQRAAGSELVVTGCMAERYGGELADALPEADSIAGFGVPVTLAAPRTSPAAPGTPARAHASQDTTSPPDTVPTRQSVPLMDLLELPRPPSQRPWAYVKAAEGCDKACGFCAIPSFRGPQRSRSIESIVAEVELLEVSEVVLVAQDLGAYGRDGSVGRRRIVELLEAVSEIVDWVRLLYLFPSELTDELVDAVALSPVPYFDLSLQHTSPPLLRAMRRPGGADSYLQRIGRIRELRPDAALRSNFIVGYPGETEEDHDSLIRFLEAARLDWCGFFAYSEEEGTHAAGLESKVAPDLAAERLAEVREIQDRITSESRDALVGATVRVLVDEPGIARSHREAPEIDGVIEVPTRLAVGEFHEVRVTAATGPDLVAVPLDGEPSPPRDATDGAGFPVEVR